MTAYLRRKLAVTVYVVSQEGVSPRRFFLAGLFGRLVGTVVAILVGSYGTQMPVNHWGLAILALAVLPQ